ncbi:MAG: hypothetical protein C0518_05065 [Opitutus sp.]|nr:hypothetical protein [Opitutus sp.]
MKKLPLTASQRHVLGRLEALAALYFSGERIAGVLPRTSAVIIGESGTGKSFLVAHLGERLKLKVLKVTVGDWMVAGGRTDPCTLETIRQWLTTGERFILHVDELDKVRDQSTAWGLAMLTEMFGLLDRRVSYRGNAKEPWGATHDRALAERVFIVGSGAWQSLWPEQAPRRIGFVFAPPEPKSGAATDIVRRVREARVIPDELFNRVSAEWLVLEPYTAEDFRGIAHGLQLSTEEFDATEAAASGLNFRYVEAALTKIALARRAREAAAASQGVLFPPETV